MNVQTLTELVINALEDVKGRDISTQDVKDLTDMTDVMVFASGTSKQHVKSLAANVVSECKKQGFQPLAVEGDDVGEWVIVDCGDLLVHVLLPEMRDFYSLEQFWSVNRSSSAE
jgi:ribosome-associated protein